MSSDSGTHRSGHVPPLADENHVCRTCGLHYRDVDINQAVELIRSVAGAVRDAVAAVPGQLLRKRPEDDRWSVTEYVCHVRDVYVTYTIRLHRARTEDRPVLEPMLNDLRARRFRYNESNLDAVLEELAAAATGFCEEVARTEPGAWERVVTRLPGEERTARWLVRQAMHEGTHHLRDIHATGELVAAAGRQGP